MRDHGGVVRENGTPPEQSAPTAPPSETASAVPDADRAEPATSVDDEGGQRQRPKLKTVRDMLLSMAVITVGAFFFFVLMPNDPSQDPVRPVEYSVEASSAARAAPYELVVPQQLDEDEWRATSVRYRHQSDHGVYWRIGFMDPDNEYVGLGQADGPAGPFVSEFSQGARDSGETVEIDGREWALYSGSKYNALVVEDADVTTVVAGTASAERLELFAASLAPHENQ